MKRMVELIDIQKKTTHLNHFLTSLHSKFLSRTVRLEVLEFNKNFEGNSGLLLLNDGQDLNRLRLKSKIRKLGDKNLIAPFVTVGIYPGERLSEYGISGYPDYLSRGEKAHLYESFIIDELLPFIKEKTGVTFSAGKTFFAGCSLGGLSAFDIALNNQHLFGGVGVFSGSFWWRNRNIDDNYSENNRIIFSKLLTKSINPEFKTWLMAGTNDEKSDRNQNGVIDSVDDTLDIFDLICHKMQGKLNNVSLNIAHEGNHDQITWSKHFPEFMKFVFHK